MSLSHPYTLGFVVTSIAFFSFFFLLDDIWLCRVRVTQFQRIFVNTDIGCSLCNCAVARNFNECISRIALFSVLKAFVHHPCDCLSLESCSSLLMLQNFWNFSNCIVLHGEVSSMATNKKGWWRQTIERRSNMRPKMRSAILWSAIFLFSIIIPVSVS